jgi:hypothetical protein
MTERVAAAIALLCFGLFLAGGIADASPTWQSASPLAPAQSPSEATVAIDANGNALAVWKRAETQPGSSIGYEVVLASYRPAGSNVWQPPVTLGKGAYWKPEVAFDRAGDATAAWISQPGDYSSQVLMSSTRSAVSGKWSPPVQLSPPGEWAYGPQQLGVDSAGDAVVAMSFGEVFYRPADGTWQAATQPIRVSYWALAVASDGSTVLAGLDVGGGSISAVSGYRGMWAAPVVLGSASQSYAPPAVAIAPGGNAVVSWATQEHGNNIVYAAVRTAGAWESAKPVSFVDGNAYDPAVGIDDRGDVLGVWDARVDPEASFRPAGASTWQRPLAIGPSIDYATPSLAMNAAGQAVAVWSGGAAAGTDFPVEAASFSTDTGWAPAQGLGTQGPQPIERNGTVAIDPAGDAIAVWPHYEGGNAAGFSQASLQTAILDNGGPLLHAVFNQARPRIRGNAHPGAKLRCTTGRWSGEAPIRFTFGWLRGAGIVGRGQSYRVKRSDTGRLLTCRVTATNTFGSVPAASQPVRVRH